MTFIAWANGEIVRIPDAWGPRFRIHPVDCRRSADGAIEAFVGGKWRHVEQWNTFAIAKALGQDAPLEEAQS